MNDYEKVNNEIKEFINIKENRPTTTQNEYKPHLTDKEELVKLLSDLLDIYKDIQMLLETKDFENVKDKIINSDVKNALVCESLMKILKDECNEKAEIKKQVQNEKLKIKKLEDEKHELNSKLNKMESDVEFTKRSSQELSRVIRDQKNLLIATKERAELEIKACESLKNVNKELEILRAKAYERVKSFESEIKVLKEKLNEKDKNIKNNNKQIKDLEKEKENLNRKILNLEKIIETQKRKLDLKENTVNICNNELAKLINKDKKNEEISEELKEKASYYEKLYKATNKQNEYLNAQLAKMINHENVDKLQKDSDLSLITTQSKEVELKSRVKKYKKKYKVHKDKEIKKQNEINDILKSIEKMKIENKRLQDEKEEALANKKQISETLMNKVETLLAQNREYQNMLIDKKKSNLLIQQFDKEDDRFEIRNNRKDFDLYNNNVDSFKDNLDTFKNKIEADAFDESFQTVKEDADSLDDSNNFVPPIKNEDIKYNDVFGKFGETKVKGEDDSTMFFHDTNFRRPFNLDNDYDEVPDKKEDKYQNFSFRNNNLRFQDNTRFPDNNLRLNVNNTRFNDNNLRFQEDKNIRIKESPPSLSVPNKFYSSLRQNGRRSEIDNPVEDIVSTDSSKSVKTTSSLKDMLKKTEDLQDKFQNLEKQLEEINESELPTTKKVQDQIRAYTDYYYSDYLDLSNDNDIL